MLNPSSVESDCLPGTTTYNKYFVFDELVSALFEGNFNWFYLVEDCDDEKIS